MDLKYCICKESFSNLSLPEVPHRLPPASLREAFLAGRRANLSFPKRGVMRVRTFVKVRNS